jgi:hypothetical protein
MGRIECNLATDSAGTGGATKSAVENHQSSRRHKAERTIAVVLICGGLVAYAIKLPVVSALLGMVGVGLYVHSQFISLWGVV